jgi:hypothetical protein
MIPPASCCAHAWCGVLTLRHGARAADQAGFPGNGGPRRCARTAGRHQHAGTPCLRTLLLLLVLHVSQAVEVRPELCVYGRHVSRVKLCIRSEKNSTCHMQDV